MPSLLMAALVLGLGWYGLKFFARASPAMVARGVRWGGAVLLGIVGLLILARGNPAVGMAAVGTALWLGGFFRLRGRGALHRRGGWRAAARRASGRSQVRSATIEMQLDHASGRMDGRIIAGPQSGRPLDTLTRPESEALYATCLRDDPEGARLLEAYLDRRFPGWGQARQPHGDARGERGGGAGGASLAEQQAYQTLGLRQGATRDEIVRAHRTLMKKLHPDYGGTTEAAARVNEAKEVLLRRVR